MAFSPSPADVGPQVVEMVGVGWNIAQLTLSTRTQTILQYDEEAVSGSGHTGCS